MTLPEGQGEKKGKGKRLLSLPSFLSPDYHYSIYRCRWEQHHEYRTGYDCEAPKVDARARRVLWGHILGGFASICCLRLLRACGGDNPYDYGHALANGFYRASASSNANACG